MPFPWYYHFGANLIQHRQRNYRIAKSAFAAYSIKRTMPYLRGSIKKYQPVGATPVSTSLTTYRNSAAIRTLQRKVNQLKPEAQQFSQANLTLFSTSYNQSRIDVSAVLAATADRDKRITGDSWKNHFLKFRIQGFEAGMQGILRVIVCRPKKAGTHFTIAENEFLDPNKLTVYYDRTMNIFSPDSRLMFGKANLKNLKTTYIGTTPEEGDVQMYVLYRNTNSTDDYLRITWELQYVDM